MSTTLRKYVKNLAANGVFFSDILHPKTKNSDPSSLLPTNESLEAIIGLGNFSELKVKQDLIEAINSDLKNASLIYEAFSIDQQDENKVTLLQEAVSSYTIIDGKDELELSSTLLDATIKILKIANPAEDTIAISYPRASSINGIISLELIATKLGLTFDDETTNEELVTLVKNALTS